MLKVSKHTNLTRNATLRLMIDVAEDVGSKPCDMLIVCILSHGKEQGKIVSSDGLTIDMETDIFRFKPSWFINELYSNDLLGDSTMSTVQH